MKKLISIILVIVFSSQEILSGQCISNNTILAPESPLAWFSSKRDLYGFIETFVLRLCAERLLAKYNANGEIRPVDKEEEIDRWIDIYKRLPNTAVKPGKFNHYLRKLIRALKVEKKDGKVVFTGQIDRKRFMITDGGELSWERIEPLEFIENKGLSARGRLRKSGYAEVKDHNDETAKRHELFHIAWINKIKTNRQVINEIVAMVGNEKMVMIRQLVGWKKAANQRVLNEALAIVWSGVDTPLKDVMPSEVLAEAIRKLGLDDIERIKMLDSSYAEETIQMDPAAPKGPGTRSEAFPKGSDEELKEPSDWIGKYTINLTERAGEITADSIYLQRKMGEIDRVFRQPEHNNMVLAGDPELANELVENIALEIARCRKEGREKGLSLSFQGADILKFNISAILGDLIQFGRYEKTMRDMARKIVDKVKEGRKKYIFYFNFQDIAWIHDQRLDMVADISTLFKSILEETGVPVIGIASEKYYQRFFVDKADNRDMQRYFSKVQLEDLETADIQILLSKYIRQAKERYKDIMPPAASIKMDLGDTLKRVLRIINELFPRYNIPVILLEIMDEVITEKVYKLYNTGLYRENLFNRMVKVTEELRDAIQKGNKELEGFLRGLLIRYNRGWQELESVSATTTVEDIEISFQDIAEKISIRKRIPVSQLIQEKEKKLDGMADALKERIVGQDTAISEIYCKFMERQRGISDKRLPFGAFVFLGPTGVGKTEVAMALADYYFDARMVRIDMSEYMEPHSVEKLFGAPGGYIGYEQGGILTNAVRENPFSLILLDEIDKAHPEVFQILNQILGEGKCTDGAGREISFSNTIIIMTGNVGMQNDENPELVRLLADIRCRVTEGGDEDKLVEDLKRLVDAQEEKIEGLQWIIIKLDLYREIEEDINQVISDIFSGLQTDIEKRLEDALETTFRGREIMGRVRALGGVISFNGLARKDLEEILNIRLREINEWLKPYKLELNLSKDVRDLVIREGYNPVMGARPLARAIRRLITAALADAILYKRISTGKKVNAELDEEGKIKLSEGEELKPEFKKEEDILPAGLEEIIGKGDIVEGLRNIYKYKPIKRDQKGAIKLDKEKLKIEIPVDMDEIQKEAEGLSQQGGADVNVLIQALTGQKEEFEKWLNDKFDSLTIKAKRNELPRAFSNPGVFSRFINVLNQKKRNNPFLLGGDTRLRDSLIEYFAVQAINGQIPGCENARLLRLNINDVVEYMPGIGMLEECMRRLIKNIEEDDERKGLRTFIVIDYDELERTVARYRKQRDTREEVFNLGFFMIPFVNSRLKVIMSSSNKRVQEYEIFHRYFSSVELAPIDSKETKEAFWLYIKDDMEKQVNGEGAKKVEVDYKILDRIISLFEKYLPGEPLMETLLDFLKRILPEKGEKGNERKRRLYGQIREIEERVNFLRSIGEVDKESLTKDERLLELIRNLIGLNKETGGEDSMSITEEDVIGYLVDIRNVPLERIGVDEFDKLRKLEENLKARVLYQDEHIDRITRSVKAGALGFKKRNQPVSALMFSGPTGCGKTETARALADSLGYNFISINLSRIKRIEHLATLIGPPPGYVGYGQNVEEYLTTKVIKNPKSVIIFDEADKALSTQITGYGGRSILDILLPIFGDGRLQDSLGQVADFSQCIVIMASNGGINEVYDSQKGIFVSNKELYSDIKELTQAKKEDVEEKYAELRRKIALRIFDYLRRMMRPEMLNRIDENIIFNPLTMDALKEIIKKQMNEFIDKVRAEHNYELRYDGEDVEDKIITSLLYSHFIPEEGARSLTEPIKKKFMGPMMDYIMARTARGKSDVLRRLKIGFKNGRITIIEEEGNAREEGIVLTEEEGIIIDNITKGLKEKGQNEPILEEELEEWLGIMPLVEEEEAVPSPFGDNAGTIKADTNDFWTRGKENKLTPGEVKKVLDGLSAELKEPSMAEIIFNWLLAGIETARRMNIEKVMADRRIFASGLNEDKPKPAGRLYRKFIEETDKKYGVEFIWEKGRDDIKLGVRFDTGIPRMLYRLLFNKQWQDDKEIYDFCRNKKLMGLYPLLSWTNKLKENGVDTNISLDNEKTILWVKTQPQITQITPKVQAPKVLALSGQAQIPPTPQQGETRISGQWQKIAEDRTNIGENVEKIAIDPVNSYIYAATWDKQTIAIIRPDGEIRIIDVGQTTHDCAVTSQHIFAATSNGIYVFNKDTEQLDAKIGNNGIIGRGKCFIGVAVRENSGNYEVFASDWRGNSLLRYTSENNYINPASLPLRDPRGLTFNNEGKLLAAYKSNVCIINPDTMKIEYDSGYMWENLNGASQAVEKNGFIYVTGYGSQKTLVFRRSNKWLDKYDEIKELVKVGELSNPSAKKPIGIGIRGEELIIACEGETGELSGIWAVKPQPQITQSYTRDSSRQKIAEDEEKIGKDVKRIAIDPDNNYIYAATGDKNTIAIIKPNGEIETLHIGEYTYACAVTNAHIFISTRRGIYVYNKDTKKLDTSIGNNGIISDKWFAGVAVREKNGGYEVFASYNVYASGYYKNRLFKYVLDDNYTTPLELQFGNPNGLTFNSESKLLVAYWGNICIINPDTMQIEYDSGDMRDAQLNSAMQAVEKNGFIYVTGYNSQKILVFRRSNEWFDEEKGIRKLVKVGELSNPSAKKPIGIGIRGDELIIACEGEKNELSNIWAVRINESPDSSPRGKVIGSRLSESETEQLRGAIREAETKGDVFDLYPQADRYREELDKVLYFLSTGPIKYRKFGRFLENERVYIKVVSRESDLFQNGNTGFVVADKSGNRREVYAFSMFNPEDNPDGSIYATIYIPEPVILKAKNFDFLEGFAVNLVHELVEIEEIRRRGLAGMILDGDMDEKAHRLAELAELDFGMIDGISTLDLFLTQPEPDIGNIKLSTEDAVAGYREKGLIEYTTMPEGLISLDITISDPRLGVGAPGRGQIGIILDSSLILNEIGMRECLDKLDKSRYIIWIMANDEREKAVLEKMQLQVQEVFVNEPISCAQGQGEKFGQLIRRLKGKVGAGNVGIGLCPTEISGISEEIRRLAEIENVPIVVPELPEEGETVSTPMVIIGILNAIYGPHKELLIVLPPVKLPSELWQKLLDEYRCAVELELFA